MEFTTPEKGKGWMSNMVIMRILLLIISFNILRGKVFYTHADNDYIRVSS